MVEIFDTADKRDCFAQLPWTHDSEEWQALDESLPEGHLAREMQAACTMLNLSALLDSYLGVGQEGFAPGSALGLHTLRIAVRPSVAGTMV